ncbi:hypothetical protein ACXVUM_16535 [Williamsia sp. SKLECPSW1]
MSAGLLGRDAFRPFDVVVSCGRVWVRDARHPVAAVFSPDGMKPERLVSWPEVTPGEPRGRPPRTAATNEGFWIQNGDSDEVALIDLEGVRSVSYAAGAELAAAGVDGAWLKRPSKLPRDLSTSPNVPPRYEPTSSLLRIGLDGVLSLVPVDGWVWNVRHEHGVLFVYVMQQPWERVLVDGTGDGTDRAARYRVAWAQSTLTVALDDPAPAALDREHHAASWLPTDTSYLQHYADQSYNPEHLRKRADSTTLRWHWGREDRWNEAMVVRAFDVVTGELTWENRTVDGWVMRATAAGTRLWVVLKLFTKAGGGTRLEVWDARDRSVTVVDSVEGLDVSAHRWPLVHRPADHASYVDHWVSRLDGSSFSEHVSEVSARWVGDWPDGHIELTFRHDGYPGLLLRDRLPLYDAVGRRFNQDTYDPTDWLFEKAGTCAYPASTHAVEGILDVSGSD